MSDQPNQIVSKISSVVFFLIMLLFYYLFASHVLYYQENNSLFLLSSDYFVEKFTQPGGLLIYLAGFLTSLFYNPITGAFILAITTTLTIILIGKAFSIYGIRNRIFPFLIGFGLFFLQTSYKYLYFNSLGLFFQLAFFIFIITRKKNWIAVLLYPFWYFLTGGFAWIFFVLIILHLLNDSIRKNWIILCALPVLSIFFMWILNEFIYFKSTFNIYFQPWTGVATGEHTLVFLTIVFLIAILPLLSKIKIRNPLQGKTSSTVREITGILLVIFVALSICYLCNDPKTQNYFKAEKLFYDQKYTELIKFNVENPTTNYITLYENNIALAETGRLNDMLFWFPQSKEGRTLFQKWEMVGEILRSGAYFYYSIGMINEAHRWAYEYMVVKGNNPEEIKMLIRTDIINGNYKTASAYINLLKKTLFYRKTALRYEKLLYDDRAVEADNELGPKRKIAPKRDFFSTTDDPLLNLKRMVASDTLNRPAFDYLMAYLMITKDYPNIIGEWQSLARYDYGRIPLHIEEAGLAISSLNDEALPKVKIQVSPETEQRFAQFLQTFQTYGSDPRAAEPELRRKFGNTYWYYVFYK